jgi:hypothetical protein
MEGGVRMDITPDFTVQLYELAVSSKDNLSRCKYVRKQK